MRSAKKLELLSKSEAYSTVRLRPCDLSCMYGSQVRRTYKKKTGPALQNQSEAESATYYDVLKGFNCLLLNQSLEQRFPGQKDGFSDGGRGGGSEAASAAYLRDRGVALKVDESSGSPYLDDS